MGEMIDFPGQCEFREMCATIKILKYVKDQVQKLYAVVKIYTGPVSRIQSKQLASFVEVNEAPISLWSSRPSTKVVCSFGV